MRWHVEAWRKLYLKCPPSWLRLSVSARGLGSELIKYVEDDGRLDIGTDEPGVAVAYMLGARPREHKRIAEDVAELIADGYLVREDRSLRIRNFVPAQDRTPGAKRTAEWRARQDSTAKQHVNRTEPTAPGTVSASHVVTSPSDTRETSHVTSPSDGAVTASRVESSRVESILVPSSVSPSVAPDPVAPEPAPAAERPTRTSKPREPKRRPEAHPRFAEVVAAYSDAFATARGAKPLFDGSDCAAVKRLLEAMKGDADRAIATIRAAYDDPFKARNATIRTIASDPSKYVGAPTPTLNRGRPVQPIGQRPQKTLEDHYRDNPPTESEVPF